MQLHRDADKKILLSSMQTADFLLMFELLIYYCFLLKKSSPEKHCVRVTKLIDVNYG